MVSSGDTRRVAARPSNHEGEKGIGAAGAPKPHHPFGDSRQISP